METLNKKNMRNKDKSVRGNDGIKDRRDDKTDLQGSFVWACDQKDDTDDGHEDERQRNDPPRVIPFHEGHASRTGSASCFFLLDRLSVSCAQFLGAYLSAKRTGVLCKIAFAIGAEVQIRSFAIAIIIK